MDDAQWFARAWDVVRPRERGKQTGDQKSGYTACCGPGPCGLNQTIRSANTIFIATRQNGGVDYAAVGVLRSQDKLTKLI